MSETGAWAPFRWADFRSLFAAAFCSTLASRALAVVLGYEVYELTGNPLALGLLGGAIIYWDLNRRGWSSVVD